MLVGSSCNSALLLHDISDLIVQGCFFHESLVGISRVFYSLLVIISVIFLDTFVLILES